MSKEEYLRELVSWLREDNESCADVSHEQLCDWADALESLLDGSARLQAHRANAAMIIAHQGRIVLDSGKSEKDEQTSRDIDASIAERVEGLAHALLAAERSVSK